MATIRELKAEGRRRLAGAATASAGREAGLLLGAILGLGEAELLARDERAVSANDRERFLALIDRRGRGEPVAYLLGRKEFFGRELRIDPRVLIPRPETEELVELVLALPLPADAHVLDIGAGSGAIALTLAAERPAWSVVATDLSLAALACARGNRARLAVQERVSLVHCNLAKALRLDHFALLVSNPPYVDPNDGALVSTDVRSYEPHLALFAERRGLAVIEGLLDTARGLATGAYVAFEFGFGQLDGLLELAARRPWIELVEVRADAAGIPRDVVFKRGNAGRLEPTAMHLAPRSTKGA